MQDRRYARLRKEKHCPSVLHLAKWCGGDVDFRERTNERDRMEDITDPYHGETIGKASDQMCAIVTLELDALVEIINGFSEPQANDQERGDADRETKDTDPSTGPLDHGPIKGGPELAEPPTEGDQAEQDEEDD
jgi:hypothetical protein